MAELYEVVLQGSYYNQTIINRWNYLLDEEAIPITTAARLVYLMGFIPTEGAFVESTLAAALQILVVPQFTFNQVFCRNIYDPTDFVEIPFTTPVPGTNVGTGPQSPVLAYGFRSTRVRLDVGRGYKRFPGVSEQATDPGGVIISSVVDLMETLALQMGGDLVTTEDPIFTYHPCVVKKFKYTTESGSTAYRYYTSEEGGKSAQLLHLALNPVWEPYPTVRTQGSRQYGRGT